MFKAQYNTVWPYVLSFIAISRHVGLSHSIIHVQSNIFVPFEKKWVSWLANILKFMEMAKEHESTVLEFIPSMENTAIQNTGNIWWYYSQLICLVHLSHLIVLATVFSLYKMVIQHFFCGIHVLWNILLCHLHFLSIHSPETELCDTPNLKALHNSYLFEINIACTLTHHCSWNY